MTVRLYTPPQLNAPTVIVTRIDDSPCYKPKNDLALLLSKLAQTPGVLTEGDRVLIEEMGFRFEVVTPVKPFDLHSMRREVAAYQRAKRLTTLGPKHANDHV